MRNGAGRSFAMISAHSKGMSKLPFLIAGFTIGNASPDLEDLLKFTTLPMASTLRRTGPPLTAQLHVQANKRQQFQLSRA
jgi:hypothetical protein